MGPVEDNAPCRAWPVTLPPGIPTRHGDVQPMFSRGRRWFTGGSIATIVTALLHTLGNTLSSPTADPGYASLEAAMRGYRVPLGLGMVPSMWDVNQSLVFTMSITLAAMGAFGIVLASSREASPGLLARASRLFLAASAALTALYVRYQITPAIICMAVVTLLFGVDTATRRVGARS